MAGQRSPEFFLGPVNEAFNGGNAHLQHVRNFQMTQPLHFVQKQRVSLLLRQSIEVSVQQLGAFFILQRDARVVDLIGYLLACRIV